MRRAVTRGLGAIVLLGAAACITGCGAKELVSVNKPIPANARTSFAVQAISGMNFTGANESFVSGGGIRLSVSSSVVNFVSILTHCGPGSASFVELTPERLVVKNFATHFDNRRCTPEQLAAADRVGAVISSSPRYRFDGERLQLISEETTVTLAYVETQDLVVDSNGEVVPGTRSG